MLLGREKTAGPIAGLNAFAAGAIVVILTTALLPDLLYGFLSRNLPWIQPHLPRLAGTGQLLAFVGDGTLAGLILGVGGRKALGFGAGFLIAGLLTQKALFELRFFPADQHPLQAIFHSALLLGLGFGLAGAASGLASGGAKRVMLPSCLGFALGGALGGILLGLPLWIPTTVLSSGWGQLAGDLAIPAALLLPHMLGGAMLGAALQQAGVGRTSHRGRDACHK